MNEIIKKNGISFGLILGLISVAITGIIYAVDLELFTKPWIGILSIIITIIIGFVVVSKTKSQLSGNISFKEAFTVYFITAIISGLISTIFNYILFNLIDPVAKSKIMELTTKVAVESFEKMGLSQDQLNDMVEKMTETDPYSLGNLLTGFAVGLIFHAIFGLILGAIFKSKSPQQY
jgi:tetrahydromethanopterin S-methyltransferase subunit B